MYKLQRQTNADKTTSNRRRHVMDDWESEERHSLTFRQPQWTPGMSERSGTQLDLPGVSHDQNHTNCQLPDRLHIQTGSFTDIEILRFFRCV